MSGMVQVDLQNIVFPGDGKTAKNESMYYRGVVVPNTLDNSYLIKSGESVDFSTYFNSISLLKWKLYSHIKHVDVHVRISGTFTIEIIGYDDAPDDIKPMQIDDEYFVAKMIDEKYIFDDNFVLCNYDERVLVCKTFESDGSEDTVVRVPHNSMRIAGVRISALSDLKFYSGRYSGSVEKENLTDVHIALVTCTFKKEDFIKRNVRLIQKEIFNGSVAVKDHLNVYVIDNGRTLNPADIEAERIRLVPNDNVGGAGGFTRGIIESLQDDPGITHILLMDDDVEVNTESFIRTFNLLRLLRNEYKGHFISGAMFFFEKRNMQYEDIGKLNHDGSYGPVKCVSNMNNIQDVIRNEKIPAYSKKQYAGWWYCCFPADIARNDNLPLPFFIRADDVEYSFRNAAGFISMNGICVWHVGFTYKFNAAMELYQVHRNSLIFQALHGYPQDVNFIRRMKDLFRAEILRFNYNRGELILDAIEDFLKGPAFIEKPSGEAVMQRCFAKNEKLLPVEECGEVYADIKRLYYQKRKNLIESLLYKLTLNGHIVPKIFLKRQPGVIAYAWNYDTKRHFFRKKVLAVNPYDHTAVMVHMSKRRFFTIVFRYVMVMLKYRIHNKSISKQYQNRKDHLTSYRFWKQYLNI